jgi:hypothetical protein
MRVALWTFVVLLALVLVGCGGDDKPSSNDASGAESSSRDLVACLEKGGFKKGNLPVGATEVEGAENVGEFVIPDTGDDYLVVYEAASAADAESKASEYFGTGINGAAAVGKRFYAYTTDTPPVQPEIESCLSAA